MAHNSLLSRLIYYRMAQRTTEYVFTDFQAEIAALIIRYCSSILHEKYNALKRNYEGIQIEHVQEDAFNQLRQSAIDLRNFLQDGYYNVSAGCIAFLQDMINGAPELVKDHPKSQDQLPHQDGYIFPLKYKLYQIWSHFLGSSKLVGGSRTTIMYSTKPEADHQSQMSVTLNQGSEQRSSSSIFMQKLNQYMRVNDSDAKKMLKDIQPTEPFENELLDSFVVYEEMQRKIITELENTKSNFEKNLREAREEADQWKTQLEMMAEDNAKQKQRLSEEIHRLHGESRQLKSRLKEENARLSRNNERTTELEARLRNTMNSYDEHKNEAKERENYMKNQYEEMQSKMITELENTKYNFEKKLRESKEEADQWKTQLDMMAADDAKQRQRLSEEVPQLQGENRQLKSRSAEVLDRLSELYSAKPMDNNLDIADRRYPNTAMKIGERFSELYDNEWTDGYMMFTEKFKLSEEAAVKLLLDILLKVYEFCKRVADEQMDCLCNIFEHPCQDIPQALTMRPQKEKVQMTQKQHKELKDLRKQIALSKVSNITKQYMTKQAEEVKQRGDKTEKSMFEKTSGYHQKCVEVCWPMVLHDPPVHMDQTVKPGVKIDWNRYRLYVGKGDILEYLIWPCLLVQGGGLISRGVAKPTKSAKGVKKS